MAFQKGNHFAKGGARKGAGPKKSKFKMLRERIELEKRTDAEYAFALFVSVMRSEKESLDLRLDCSREIMNRVLGKPRERTESSGGLIIKIVREDYRAETAAPSPEASADQTTGEEI